jgi:hypothetical protein
VCVCVRVSVSVSVCVCVYQLFIISTKTQGVGVEENVTSNQIAASFITRKLCTFLVSHAYLYI